MIRVPSHIQVFQHGICFFRVVLKHLLKALDGRGEIENSLGTRGMRLGLRAARLLAAPTTEEILANAESLRELKSTSTVNLGNGKSLHYSLETSSNDPAEIAAFHAEASRLQSVQDAQLVQHRERSMEVPEVMADY